MLTSVNPYTNEVIEKYEESTSESIDRMLHDSDKDFNTWKDKSIDERVAYIKECAEQLKENQEIYAAAIDEVVFDEFLETFKNEMEQLKFGDPMDEHTDYGPLSSVDQKNVLSKQIEKSIEKGANVHWQGKKAPSNGAFINPVILTNIRSDMPVYNEEVFGPVACMFSFNTEKEAILLANDTQFGLGASVWTRDIDYARDLAREIEAGLVYINDEVSSKPELPFGGIKKSGVGREMSEIGILEFTNKKAIWIPK